VGYNSLLLQYNCELEKGSLHACKSRLLTRIFWLSQGTECGVKCDEGYMCAVCGADVADMIDSALYLRYVLGEVPLDKLHLQSEQHIRCDPSLAQFIVDPAFAPVTCTGPFAKANLDAVYVLEQEERVTKAWRRLQELPTMGLPITEYPLEG
jgi:hypothetical protein